MNEKLRVIISAEVAKAQQGVKKIQGQIKTFQDKVKEASKTVDSKFKAMGTSIANAAKTIGTSLLAAAGALLALGASTEEYRQNQAKLKTAFETAGASASVATETYNNLYRVLGDGGQATEAAQHLAKLTTEEKALSQWTTICQGVYATFGESLPIESLTEAANETAKTGTLTGALADALNWAGVSEEDFQKKLEACNTEAEREKLIRETLNGLYTDAATKYEAANAKILAQRDAQAKLQGQMAVLGEAMVPIQTAFTNFGATLLEKINPYITALAENLLPLLEPLLTGIANALETAIGYIVDNWGTISAIAGVILAIVAAIGLYNVVAAVKAAMDAAQVTTLGALIAAQAASAAATIAAILPYILIVAAIAAVIAIIVYLVKNWDEVKAKVVEVWGAVVAKFEEVKEKVGTAISTMVDNVVSFFTDLWTKITDKAREISTDVRQTFDEIKTKLGEIVENIKTSLAEKFENIKSAISEKITSAKETVSSIFTTIKTTISDSITAAKTKVSTVLSTIVSAFKSKFNSAKNTVRDVFDNIKKSITDKINAAKDKVSGVIDAIKGFFNFKFQWPSIPMPHFGVSPAGWQVGDLLKGSIPKLSINWYAKGGVFDTPSLFAYGNGSLGGLGEHGAEAVVPLENNLGWLDKLATMLNDRLDSGKTIVLNVDGKVFAQTAVSSINQLTRQTGNLALEIL